MKRLYFSLVVIALTLSSCNTIVKKFSGLTSNDLTTDSVVFHKDAEHATVHFYVDFPTDGNELLVNAVQEYINEQLGGTYTGSQTEAQPMLDYYGAEQWDSLKVEYQDMTADGDADWMSDVSLYADKSIRKVYETEKIVTYVTQSDIYLGGAHGMQYEYGVTFRKSDGRRFGYDMMRQLYSDGFYQLTKKGLQDYFGEAGVDATRDEKLKEYLLTDDDVNALSHPVADPYMTEQGVHFLYQPYEIAPYAAGMPAFTISYEDIKPYLTIGALKLIP